MPSGVTRLTEEEFLAKIVQSRRWEVGSVTDISNEAILRVIGEEGEVEVYLGPDPRDMSYLEYVTFLRIADGLTSPTVNVFKEIKVDYAVRHLWPTGEDAERISKFASDNNIEVYEQALAMLRKSSTGHLITADGKRVYVESANGHILAFDALHCGVNFLMMSTNQIAECMKPYLNDDILRSGASALWLRISSSRISKKLEPLLGALNYFRVISNHSVSDSS